MIPYNKLIRAALKDETSKEKYGYLYSNCYKELFFLEEEHEKNFGVGVLWM